MVVSVSAATAPTTGQILKATSGTTATWQNEAGGTGTVIVSTSLGDKTGPGIAVTSSTYLAAGMLTVIGSVATAGNVVFRQASNGTGQIRYYNLTKANVLFESAVLSNADWATVNMGSVVNAPSLGDVIEIQVKRVTGTGSASTQVAFCSMTMNT